MRKEKRDEEEYLCYSSVEKVSEVIIVREDDVTSKVPSEAFLVDKRTRKTANDRLCLDSWGKGEQTTQRGEREREGMRGGEVCGWMCE
jgi:hypothetical protein